MYAIAHGTVLTTLRGLPDNSFDGLLSDPPYGLGTRQPTVPELLSYLQGEELNTGGEFMGKKWQVPSVSVWREAYRVLKPGAPMLVFGGTRMFDLITLGIRAAGFEIRDCLTWLYGKGFPKGARVDNELWKRAKRCLLSEHVKHVEQVSPGLRLTDSGFVVAAARIQPEGVPALLIQTGEAAGSSVLTAISLSTLEVENIASNTTLSWKSKSADDYAEARTFITETESETTIDSKISSLLTGLLIFANTIPAKSNPINGAPVSAWLVESSSRDGATKPSVIPALTALGGVTSNMFEAWHGFNLALKPGWEAIILARKPLDGTVAENVARWGTGGLAIDACRIGVAGGTVKANCPKGESNGIYGDGINGNCDVVDLDAGRWPANVCLDEEAAVLLDETVGNRPSRPSVTRHGGGNHGGPVFEGRTSKARPDSGYSDSGGPSRFFKVTTCDLKSEYASIAGSLINLARKLNGIALTSAAPPPVLEELLSTFVETNYPARPTQEMPSESVVINERDIEQTKSSAGRCLLELKRIEAFLVGRASVAEQSVLTGITRITISLSKCTSYVESVISACTRLSSELGAGGYERFKYCAKVSTKERELGCEALPRKSAGETTDREDDSAGLSSPRAGAGRTSGAHNHHPTLKPIALTTLARVSHQATYGRGDATRSLFRSGLGDHRGIAGGLARGIRDRTRTGIRRNCKRTDHSEEKCHYLISKMNGTARENDTANYLTERASSLT